MLSSIRSLPKDTWYFIEQKRKQSNVKKYKISHDCTDDIILQDLTNKGFANYESLLDSQKLIYLREQYGLIKENFTKFDSNISLPFVNSTILKRLDYGTELGQLIKKFFHICYKITPVLQSLPHIIVTNSLIKQDSFNEKIHRIPAFFHTDYPTEVTIHIPLTDITAKTPRTMYLNGSAMDSFIRPMKKYDAKRVVDKFKSSELFAKAGDALVIDVTGVHKAVIEPKPRIMLQLKFTSEKNILNKLSTKKLNSQIEHARSNFRNYKNYIKLMNADWIETTKSNLLTSQLKSEIIRLSDTIKPFFLLKHNKT